MQQEIVLKGCAKINLALDILPKENPSDAFHQVKMIMQSIDLSDEIRVRVTMQENFYGDLPKIFLTMTNHFDYVPNDLQSLPMEKNLAYRAAKLFCETYKKNKMVKQCAEIHIDIQKKIPSEAGLAGGSSNAATVLIALNRLFRARKTRHQLALLGQKLGMDVAFCCHGGTMLATGRGEILQKLPHLPSCWCLIVKPPVAVSTAEAYRRFDEMHAKLHHPKIFEMIDCLEKKNLEGVFALVENIFEPIVAEKFSIIEKYHDTLENEAEKFFKPFSVCMSGSGSALFVLSPSKKLIHHLCENFSIIFPESFVKICQTNKQAIDGKKKSYL